MRPLPFHALTFSIVLFLLYTVDHAVSENDFEQYEDVEMDTIEGQLDNEINELKEKIQKKIGAHEPTETNGDRGEEERKDRHDAERQPSAQVLKPKYTKHKQDETGQANMATGDKPKISRAQPTRRKLSRISSVKKSSRRLSKGNFRKAPNLKESTSQKLPSRPSQNTRGIKTNPKTSKKQKSLYKNLKEGPATSRIGRDNKRYNKTPKNRKPVIERKLQNKSLKSLKAEKQNRQISKSRQDEYDRKPTYTKHKQDETGQANMATEDKPKVSRAQPTHRRLSRISSVTKPLTRVSKGNVMMTPNLRKSTSQKLPSRPFNNTGGIGINLKWRKKQKKSYKNVKKGLSTAQVERHNKRYNKTPKNRKPVNKRKLQNKSLKSFKAEKQNRPSSKSNKARYDRKPTYTKHKTDETGQANKEEEKDGMEKEDAEEKGLSKSLQGSSSEETAEEKRPRAADNVQKTKETSGGRQKNDVYEPYPAEHTSIVVPNTSEDSMTTADKVTTMEEDEDIRSAPPADTLEMKDESANHCDSDPCLNDGVCESKDDGFVCTCTEGYIGDTCSEKDGKGNEYANYEMDTLKKKKIGPREPTEPTTDMGEEERQDRYDRKSTYTKHKQDETGQANKEEEKDGMENEDAEGKVQGSSSEETAEEKRPRAKENAQEMEETYGGRQKNDVEKPNPAENTSQGVTTTPGVSMTTADKVTTIEEDDEDIRSALPGETLEMKDESANACDSDPCLNDGMCESKDDGFVCTCAEGYSGDTCSDAVTGSPLNLNLNLNMIIMGSLAILLMVALCVLFSLICHVMRERSRTKEDYESMLANEQPLSGSEWKDVALSVARKRMNAVACGAICCPCFAGMNDKGETDAVAKQTDAVVQEHLAKFHIGRLIGPTAINSEQLRHQRKSLFIRASRDTQRSKASSGTQRAGSMTSRVASSKNSNLAPQSVSQHSSRNSRSLERNQTSRRARSAGSVPRSASNQTAGTTRSFSGQRSMSRSPQGQSLSSRSSGGQQPISLGKMLNKLGNAKIKATASSRKSAGSFGRDSRSPSRDSTRMTLSGGSGFTSGASVCSSRPSASPSRISRSPSPKRPSPKMRPRPRPQTRDPVMPDSSPQSDSGPEY